MSVEWQAGIDTTEPAGFPQVTDEPVPTTSTRPAVIPVVKAEDAPAPERFFLSRAADAVWTGLTYAMVIGAAAFVLWNLPSVLFWMGQLALALFAV